MGFSSTTAAGDTMRRITKHHEDGFLHVRGTKFFLEWGTDEHERRDGAIIGTVHLAVIDPHGSGYKSRHIANFRIEPNGDFTEGPEWLRKFAEA